MGRHWNRTSPLGKCQKRHKRPPVRRLAEPCCRTISPPTAPGWQCRSWRVTWPAGQRGLVWVSRSWPPRPSDDGSSPWPAGSAVRHAASPCICHSASLGKPSSVAPWPGCEPSHSRPEGLPATDPTTPKTRTTRSAGVPCCVFSRHPAHRSSRRRPQGPCPATEDRPPTSNLSQWSPGHLPCSFLTPFRCPHSIHPCPSVDSG